MPYQLNLIWSGQRDSNPRHPAWEADTLPAELCPLSRFEANTAARIGTRARVTASQFVEPGTNLAVNILRMAFRRRQSTAGFTLIELLIVVAVIGLLAAIAIPNLLTAIHKARQKRSMGDIRTVGSALAMYQRDNAFYPVVADGEASTLRPLLSIYVGSFSDRDGWMTQFGYNSDGSEYTLVSYGRNRNADPPYNNGTTGDFDCDIVFSEGVFVQWPEGTQH